MHTNQALFSRLGIDNITEKSALSLLFPHFSHHACSSYDFFRCVTHASLILGHGLSFNPSATPPLATVDTLAATSLTRTTTTSSTSFQPATLNLHRAQFNPTGPDSVSVALPNHETNYANHNRRLTTPEDRGRGWAIVRRRSRCNSLMQRCASAADGHGKSCCFLSVAAPPDHDDDGKRGPSGAQGDEGHALRHYGIVGSAIGSA